MKRFYLTCHRTFANRGCEAIVRSTAGLLRQRFGDVEVQVPSNNIRKDWDQWPDAESHGVRFVPAFCPWYTCYWVHLQRLPVPALKRAGWPFALPGELHKLLGEVDAVLSIGGDIYSLDYRLPSLCMGMDRAAMDEGTPVVLWGASVGPFEAEPHFLPVMRQHLERMSLITARESVTVEYLRMLGLSNVVPVVDPAFILGPEAVDIEPFWPRESESGVLGLNISSLVRRCRPKEEPRDRLLEEVAKFIRFAVEETGHSVLLVPHVVPWDGGRKDNDAHYLAEILAGAGDMGGRVTMMDPSLNAPQIKYVLSRCRFFIGARTHATIAALSSCTPTVSIAYSIKAKGINRDLFGHTDYLLEASRLNTGTLKHALLRLMAEEEPIKISLAERIPIWQSRAEDGTKCLEQFIGR